MYLREKKLKKSIIDTGRRLYQQGLAVASSGNISARLSAKEILITASQAQLGSLKFSDIVKVNINQNCYRRPPSSELPLHKLVYQNFKVKTILHCHPPLTNGYFAVNSFLKPLTFETRFYLGEITGLKQETPTVTCPQEVIKVLKNSNIVVLKNHGVVVIGDNLEKNMALAETLEAAVKSALVARVFGFGPEVSPEQKKVESGKAYPMFSRQHIEKIVDLVNQDQFIGQKGKELNLDVQLAIELSQSNKAYKFTFEKGRIVKLDFDSQAPFLITASPEIWREVFLGKIDPFVAVTQGKMNLKGEIGQLSRWYVPFSRLFELFKQVKFD